MPTPAENMKKHLDKRAKKAMSGKKIPTPSETHSKNMRKKLTRGSHDSTFDTDCHTCPNKPCEKSILSCGEHTMKRRCKQCGKSIVYRFDAQVPFQYCNECKGRFVHD